MSAPENEPLLRMVEQLRAELLRVDNLRAPCDLYISQALIARAVKEADVLLANFRRSSQNQTVSSGVGGAHEGTTADKSVALAESSLSSPPQNVYEILRWFVAKSNHEGFCGQCPPVNKGTTCKCDWPEMKKRAEDALLQAQGK